MPGCLSESEVDAVVSGTIPEHDQVRVRAHLQQCAVCRVRVEFRQQNQSRSASDSRDQPSTTGGNAAGSADESSTSRVPGQWTASLPTIEGYELISEVHRGAQGIVYKAVQKSTHRTVAIKLLAHEQVASNRQKQRFEREVSLAASLRHPHIVTIYDSGLMSGRYYFAMEYIHGQPLDVYLAAADLKVKDKLKLFAMICAAVSYAHGQGVIHRDLKPANILVDARGEPHIVDFGLAKPAGMARPAEAIPLTLTSQFMGTLAYASPEQTKGDPALIDARSDVYCLGVILFEMLTGQFPYPLSGDLVKMFQTICTTEPVKPSSLVKDSSADIDTIVLRALAKEPERRYQSVAEFGRDIQRSVTGEPIWARRDSLAYVIRVRGTRALQRHRVLTALGVIALATVFVQYGGGELLRWWPAPSAFFEAFYANHLARPVDPSAFQNVRIIAITDSTQSAIDSLVADNKDLKGVSAANTQSFRRMHGLLMNKLADAGARTVVWDVNFRVATGFDGDFVRGIEAMRGKPGGGVVVLGTKRWDLVGGKPQMSPEIMDADAPWGGVSISSGTQAAWRMDVIFQHQGQTPILSMDMQALSAWRAPSERPSAVFDKRERTVQLQYSAGVMNGEPVPLSTVQTALGTEDEKVWGIQAGDLVGQYVIQLPSDSVLKPASLEYQEVMRASPDQLKKWFAGRLVVIGDFRTSTGDVAEAPDGRMINGATAHAIAIDQLLRGASIRYVHGYWYVGMIAAGAGLGVAAIWLSVGRRRRRALMLAAGAGIVIVMSIAAFRYLNVLCNPLLPAAAMLLAAGAFAIVDQARRLPDDLEFNRRGQA